MQKTALKYHGGGAYKAKKIVTIAPSYNHYVESHFGGGSVLFALNPANKSEIVNDVDDLLMTFWYVLQQEELFVKLQRLLQATPPARRSFEKAMTIINRKGQACDQVTIAWAIFTFYRQSRQALGKDFMTLTKNRLRKGMNEQASAWTAAIDGLPEFRPRLQRVVLECTNGTKLIKRQDAKDLWVYVDPTFYKTTRVAGEYRYEMTHEEHVDLLDVLGEMKGKFTLSGYDCELYQQKRKQYGFHRFDFLIDNKASSKKEKTQRVESLWTNYLPSEEQLAAAQLTIAT